MPSTYAHRRYGADVLERLPAELQEKIAPYRELSDIGLHGLVANPQPNPACAESCEQLDALYQKALPLAERLILEYRDTLQTGAPLDQAYQHTFGEN